MQTIQVLTKSRLTINHLRKLSRCAILSQNVETQPISNLTIPPPNIEDKPVSPKIEKLVTEISQLNLIEVSELSGLLKKRLNLPDAPAFPVGGFAPIGASPAEEEDEEPKKVKTIFTVKLMKFDETKKVPLIKEIKSLLEGMNLVQAKKFVESAPAVVKADVPKEEADKLKEALEKAGGTVEVE